MRDGGEEPSRLNTGLLLTAGGFDVVVTAAGELKSLLLPEGVGILERLGPAAAPAPAPVGGRDMQDMEEEALTEELPPPQPPLLR